MTRSFRSISARSLHVLMLLCLTSLVGAPIAHAQSHPTPEALTIVIQINLHPGVDADAAVGAMNDMRALIRKQPGYLGGESLRNNTPGNAPAIIHVTRWAAIRFWEGVFLSPEFNQLNAAGVKKYSVTIGAFKQLE